MTNNTFKKLNIFLDYDFNEFHTDKLRSLIEDENVSVDRFRYLCTMFASAEENNDPYWTPKYMESNN